ncbi:MAG: hypothetical protein U9R32_07605, partial [Bacteroidota bacterium]|nr:hypothetical protein [Bacteroidota bacterium]
DFSVPFYQEKGTMFLKKTKKNIMLNRNLNALVSGQTNYKRMKRAMLKLLIHTRMIIMATSIRPKYKIING